MCPATGYYSSRITAISEEERAKTPDSFGTSNGKPAAAKKRSKGGGEDKKKSRTTTSSDGAKRKAGRGGGRGGGGTAGNVRGRRGRGK